MANRRMFSKSITNSSKFLKMPVSSRLLYYDLGMNADDDGFVEHFMVLRMTGATQQDLGVLEINGLVKVFDENVLWIRDWKENNYIRNDRYQPSKYIAMYNLDTIGIPEVSTGKDRLELGKDNINNMNIIYNWDKNEICECLTKQNEKCLRRSSYNIDGKNYCNQHSKPIIGDLYIESKIKKTKKFVKPTLEEVQQYCEERNNNVNAEAFIDFYESKGWKVGKNSMKDWKACVRNWERNKTKPSYKTSRDRINEVYERFLEGD